ncbi:hypothetical protein AQUCO_01300554v1 [Aquilegia coerulea]|uniref:VTT domain-containing protein n=1 Tax=Aquilegia coerulea TaxID=218851 RepID=A0A2G5E291_AQUCA|nr:hypothetical protein AQUCO_01300554v1 [Aquilegia coerulea]PIA49894.1 hypothetical protein AQUCO_01300554v1 [Aquilegia coerulea]
MTYKDDSVVPELKLNMDDRNGDYVRLMNSEEVFGGEEPPSPRKKSPLLWWLKVILFCIIGIALGVVFIIWVGPFLLNKVVPILDWEIRTFSPLVLGVFLFASLVLFPSILLPSTPSIWVAGITFGYGFGFLLILPAMSIGMSLPYFIGSLFRHKINMWLEKWPEKAAFMRLAGEGNWFHQFRAVFLLRISPFPFVIYNYAAVATNVKYGPYILGSVAGVVPEIFVTIYSGILIRRLADASQSHHSMSTTEIIYNCIGFSMTTAATVAITIYAKRALKKLQSQEELLD